jgi:hypothetical protein
VKTSHAWFVAYAPLDNPQIVMSVFVYGGNEGSTTAAPVVNDTFRYFFNLDEPESDTDTDTAFSPLSLSSAFESRLLGTDAFPGSLAAVSGFVLDGRGQGVAETPVQILNGGQVVAEVLSGPTGQFDYNMLDPQQGQNWQIRLPLFANAQPISLMVNPGVRYYVEFVSQNANTP